MKSCVDHYHISNCVYVILLFIDKCTCPKFTCMEMLIIFQNEYADIVFFYIFNWQTILKSHKTNVFTCPPLEQPQMPQMLYCCIFVILPLNLRMRHIL
jgi:hypothetical protein